MKVLMLDVTEIQMERYHSSGEVAPHIHLVFLIRNRTGSGSRWLVSPAEVQELWDSAWRSVLGASASDEPNRTKTELIERSVFGYLSKYMSKGGEDDEIDWNGWENLRPRQWCSQSTELKRAVESMTTHYPGVFMDWLELNDPLFRGRGFYHFKAWAPDDIPVGNMAEVQFYSPEAELTVFVQFLRDWRRNIRAFSGLPDEQFDPVTAFGLPAPPADLQAQLPRTLPIGAPGTVPQDLRKRLDILFRDSQIAEPVFGGAVDVLVNEGTETQLDFFAALSGLGLECHSASGVSDE